jgi:hypothetical protein
MGAGSLPPCRVTMPCRWRETPLGEFVGTVRCRRRFGLPRRIDAHERVWLTLAGLSNAAAIWLNGTLLGRHAGTAPLAFEVTAYLRDRNEVLVEVESTSGADGPWGEVALEVRCTAYLQTMRAWWTTATAGAILHAAGEVVGDAERPLDLYLLHAGQTLACTSIVARSAGQPFALTSEPLPADQEHGEVRVELVNGGSLWYQWTAPGS